MSFNKWITLFAITLNLMFLNACRHDPDLDGLTEVSYETSIAPILSSGCTYSNCHGIDGEQFSLLTYEEVMRKVKAFDAHKSDLYQSIVHKGLIQAMPPSGYQQLTNDQITLIYVWIEQGAKNN
jgi:uncharacterized membrane protein